MPVISHARRMFLILVWPLTALLVYAVCEATRYGYADVVASLILVTLMFAGPLLVFWGLCWARWGR